MLRSARSAITFLALSIAFEAFVLLFDLIFVGFSGTSNLVLFQYFDVAGILVAVFAIIAVAVTKNVLILIVFFILTIAMTAAFVVDLILRNSMIGFPGIIAFVEFFAAGASIILFAVSSVQEYRNAIETNDINHGKLELLQSDKTLNSSLLTPGLTPVVVATSSDASSSSAAPTSNRLDFGLTKRNVGVQSEFNS
jgi:hypothetical protein